MMKMNWFCGMVDQRRAFSLISSRDHCHRSSPSRISDTPRSEFEPAQNLSSGFDKRSCAVVITTLPRCSPVSLLHIFRYLWQWSRLKIRLNAFFLVNHTIKTDGKPGLIYMKYVNFFFYQVRCCSYFEKPINRGIFLTRLLTSKKI